MAEEEKSTPEVPILSRLRPPPGAVRKKRRKGRGIGSGLGKTSGKGMKGQKARHPGDFGMLGFEGGQMPLYRRLPKRGFKNPFTKVVGTCNVQDLARFDADSVVTIETLQKAGLVKKNVDRVKVLGQGDLDKALTVRVHAYSTSAKAKIEKAGGKAELLEELAKQAVEG